MFFRVWKLRGRSNHDFLVGLRSLDICIALFMVCVVASNQSFLNSGSAWKLFIGGIGIALVKNYFEKKRNYRVVYLAFTMQLIIHLILYPAPTISGFEKWVVESMTNPTIHFFIKGVVLYFVIMVILLFIFSMIHFGSCIKGFWRNVKKSIRITHFFKQLPYRSVEEMKSKLYQQSEMNDLLITPFEQLLSFAHQNQPPHEVAIIHELREITKQMICFSNPISLRKQKIITISDLITYLWE